MLGHRETEESIDHWTIQTFGLSQTNASIVARANQEMSELVTKVSNGASDADLVEEAADIVIVLNRLFMRNGYRMSQAVDRKMQVNRKRQWAVDVNGHGQHVEGT